MKLLLKKTNLTIVLKFNVLLFSNYHVKNFSIYKIIQKKKNRKKANLNRVVGIRFKRLPDPVHIDTGSILVPWNKILPRLFVDDAYCVVAHQVNAIFNVQWDVRTGLDLRINSQPALNGEYWFFSGFLEWWKVNIFIWGVTCTKVHILLSYLKI